MRRVCRYCGVEFDGDPGASACPDCVSERRRQVVRERVCRVCGAAFTGGPRAWYCPACRLERRRRQDAEYAQRRRAGKVRAIGSEAVCERCGGKYVVASGAQRYCPACAPEAWREADRAAALKWYADNMTAEGRRDMRKAHAAAVPCAVCGRLFVPATPARTCSPECSRELARRSAAKWEREHREERNAYHRELRKKKGDDK